jgi:hypothetical protein
LRVSVAYFPGWLVEGDLGSGLVWHRACSLFTFTLGEDRAFRHNGTQLAWMEHPAIWLCESCAILWLVLRAVRFPVVRTGVLLMLCGLGMNARVTDTNAGSMPVIGMPSTTSCEPDVAGCDVANAVATVGRSSTARTV